MTTYQKPSKPATAVLEQGIAPLPLESAESTLWTVRRPGPSRGKTGTMAELYAAGDMDIGDYAWIILNWSNPQTKRAAYTLLAHQLKQPVMVQTVLRHGPTVIGGSTYLEEQQYESMYNGLFAALWGVVCAVMLTGAITWTAVSRMLEGHYWAVTLVAALICVAILVGPFALYARHDFKKQMAASRNFRQGREGEQWVAERVSAQLDSRWTAFRNLKLPNRKGDLDLVLVGPAGVYVLEVKAYGRTVRVNNGVWEEQHGRHWRSMSDNPQAQATGGAVDLRDWLNRHNIVIPYVDKAVVLTQPQGSTEFVTAKAPVWLHFDLDNQLSTLNNGPAELADETREQIVGVLKEAMQKSKK